MPTSPESAPTGPSVGSGHEHPHHLALDERAALCDTALAVGADAPTLAGDWTVKDLLCHLLVRERSLLGAAGHQGHAPGRV